MGGCECNSKTQWLLMLYVAACSECSPDQRSALATYSWLKWVPVRTMACMWSGGHACVP